MLIPFFVAAIAAIPAVKAQDVTASVTRCETRFGMFPAPTGASLATWYNYATTTKSFQITSTTQETTTITPSATTFTNVVSTTATFFTTVTSVPAAATIPAPVGFFPLLASRATATATARFKRGTIESRTEHNLRNVKRQTREGNTAGFIARPDGTTSNLNRMYPHRVVCRVTFTVNSTSTTIVTGLPKTEVLVPATATAVSTSTFSVTETILEVVPRPTFYAACQENNIVNQVPGFDGEMIYLDRIVFRPNEGFPIANSLVVNTTSATNCCIACQNQPFCAGSFYAPSRSQCHLQLTQAAPQPLPPTLPGASSSASLLPPYPLPTVNTSLPYPTASAAPYPVPNNTSYTLPTGSGGLSSSFTTLLPTAIPIPSSSEGVMSILPISAPASTGTPLNPGAGTCSIGSLSLYLGVARGQTEFPEEYAVYFSNGPCGRLSIDFLPWTEDEEEVPVKRI